MHEPRKLKRLIIKEELVELCSVAIEKAKDRGENISIDPIAAAIVLQQMLYWGERVKDFDKFILEENKRAESEGINTKELINGWIYKSAEELETELMGFRSAKTISRILNFFVSMEWLASRNNPNFKWDKTYQYRVNILQLQIDLHEIGFALEGYKPLDFAFLKMSNRKENHDHIEEDKMSNRRGQNVGAIPIDYYKEKEEEEEGAEFKNEKTNEFEKTSEDDSNDFSEEIISFQNFTGIELRGLAHKNIYIKWRREWRFSYEMIIKAAELMCKLAKTPNLDYLEQILIDWKRQNITTPGGVDKLLNDHKKTRTSFKGVKTKEIRQNTSTFGDYEIYVPPKLY